MGKEGRAFEVEGITQARAPRRKRPGDLQVYRTRNWRPAFKSGERGRGAAGSSQSEDWQDMGSDLGGLQTPHQGLDVLFCS